MIRRFYQNHRATIEKYDQFLLNNPVLERGLVVAPIIVTCNTLGNACALSIAFACITLLAVALTFFIPRNNTLSVSNVARDCFPCIRWDA